MLRIASSAILALALCLTLGLSAEAGSKPTAQPAPSGPTAPVEMKASKPGPVKDIYCTHDTTKSKLPACGDSFKAKCDEIGGTLNDPTGNPDYGACIHDDHW